MVNARADADPTSGVAPVTVVYSAKESTSDGKITSYEWQFQDGAVRNGVRVARRYRAGDTGSQNGRVVVEDTTGDVDTDVVRVTVEEPNESPTAQAKVKEL
jgi:hypothetical protein